MKKYQKFILEYVRNEKNTKWFIKKILNEIKILNPTDFYYHVNFDRTVWHFDLTTSVNFESQSENIINRYQKK